MFQVRLSEPDTMLSTNAIRASIFRRQLNMKHTDWVNYCAECLGQRAEYPSDQCIKALIEIQLLARKSELEVEDPTHTINNDELVQSIDVLEDLIEQLLVQNKKCNTCMFVWHCSASSFTYLNRGAAIGAQCNSRNCSRACT